MEILFWNPVKIFKEICFAKIVANFDEVLETESLESLDAKLSKPGVGNDFFSRGVQGGGFGPRAQGGIRGWIFGQKIDQFPSKFKF